MIDVNCENPAALETIEYNPCVELLGKVARFAFGRVDEANNTFVNGTNGIEEETAWDAYMSASDDSKIVVSPKLEDVVFNEPDIIEDGENIDGAPFAIATNAQLVTAYIRNISASQLASLKKLKNEGELGVFFIGRNRKIGAKLISESPDTHGAIPISPDTFQIKDPAKEGTKAGQFRAMLQFYLPEGWYMDFQVVAAETGFIPHTEIRP